MLPEVIQCSLALLCHSRGRSGLFPWRLLSQPVFMEVPSSGQVLQCSPAWVCSLGSHCLVPAPVEVAGSGLLSWRSLTLAWSCAGLWLGLAPSAVIPLYLLPFHLSQNTYKHTLRLMKSGNAISMAWSLSSHWTLLSNRYSIFKKIKREGNEN